MRVEVYSCDCCSKVFGEKEHLNIKGLTLNKSTLDSKSNPPRWKSQCIVQSSGREFHFCNIQCFDKFLSKIINKKEKKK